jgi:malonyl CoA-acyl carrier protein transacylase
VISGDGSSRKACEAMKAAGAKRALILPVGAFHSPMMEPAREELEAAIEATTFATLVAQYIKMSQQQRFLHQKRLRKPYTTSKMDAISTTNDC